jgi:epoxyqueuosine reductase
MMTDEPLGWLRDEIQRVLTAWVEGKRSDNYWREPLVAVASAGDPRFAELRRVVNPEHAMPDEILPGARAVVVFFLPFQEWVGRENAQAGGYAARSWALSYLATNQLIHDINTHLQGRLEEAGQRAGITPATHNFDEQKLISRWSHRHLAYLAGMGTFGRHNLLITAAGCCGRVGSFVTTMPLAPTPRPATEFCLAKAGSECSACTAMCTYDALFETRFERHRCYEQLLANDRYYHDLPLVDVCGKCACEVPCSYRIPSSG